MPKLKKIINHYMYKITLIMMLIIIMTVSVVQTQIEHNHVQEEALLTLAQIEQIMYENHKELERVKAEYEKTCLLNAKVVSSFIENEPEILYDVERLRDIALNLEVDEINVFNEEGYIISGTHPNYFGMSMDSGEQIGFFKPLLTDKSLELVQEATPNTAESRLVQYSALWSKDGRYIIEIGMENSHMEKAIAKNELSYIFSLFRVNPNISYHAVNAVTGEIEGSTEQAFAGRNIEETGVSFKDVSNAEDGIYVEIGEESSFCVFRKVDSLYIGYATSLNYMYRKIPFMVCTIFVCVLVAVVVLMAVFNEHVKNQVSNKIDRINSQLNLIKDGNLDNLIEEQSIYEFEQLKININTMVQSIINSNTKLTHILSKIHMYIGTYEYNVNTGYIRLSEYIPVIFSLDDEVYKRLKSNPSEFNRFIESVKTSVVKNEKDIICYGDKFIKIEEFQENEYILGVVTDVTNEIHERQKLEDEIYIDSLTGLYNKKGVELRISKMLGAGMLPGYHAMILLKVGNLAEINEKYGRENGDVYLKKIASLIRNFGIKESVAARRDGGEFVLFIYDYDSESELMKAINLLSYIEKNTSVQIYNMEVPVKFSFKYSIWDNTEIRDYHEMLRDVEK